MKLYVSLVLHDDPCESECYGDPWLVGWLPVFQTTEDAARSVPTGETKEIDVYEDA